MDRYFECQICGQTVQGFEAAMRLECSDEDGNAFDHDWQEISGPRSVFSSDIGETGTDLRFCAYCGSTWWGVIRGVEQQHFCKEYVETQE